MNTLADFQKASFEEKCDWVTGSSNYLFARKLGNAKVYLYHAGDFFIEVYYSPAYKKILMINAFCNPDGLDPYLDHISISDLRLD
jgi:hypothetical protein